jgi:hypothetical protein
VTPKRGRYASASFTNALVVARAVFASVHGERPSRYAPSVSADPRGVAIARSIRERIATLEELVRDAKAMTFGEKRRSAEFAALPPSRTAAQSQ